MSESLTQIETIDQPTFLRHFQAMAATGADVVPDFTDEATTQKAAELLRDVEFLPADKQDGPVYKQDYRVAPFLTPEADDFLNQIAARLESLVYGCSLEYPGVSDWNVTHTVVQRYGKKDGLSSHRDSKDEQALIAAWTVQGWARLLIRHERYGRSRRYDMRPGTLSLLRSYGLVELPEGNDPREFHEVYGPRGQDDRIVVVFHNRVYS